MHACILCHAAKTRLKLILRLGCYVYGPKLDNYGLSWTRPRHAVVIQLVNDEDESRKIEVEKVVLFLGGTLLSETMQTNAKTSACLNNTCNALSARKFHFHLPGNRRCPKCHKRHFGTPSSSMCRGPECFSGFTCASTIA